jgi:hypothetical protein
VFAKIGFEATGRPFNSVTAVVDMPTHTGNSLVNARMARGLGFAVGRPATRAGRAGEAGTRPTDPVTCRSASLVFRAAFSRV